ncbi:unnamed protein product [Dovyalis caffra]|uniref:Uncharacterized protein n=1 Tax=Dovyalis caffra TaxID=77055 RepID=A0AAV1R2F3_9ROSI|nr:unnamed protein product [Dovyalis caffra]
MWKPNESPDVLDIGLIISWSIWRVDATGLTGAESEACSWLCSVVYGSTRATNRELLWDNLTEMRESSYLSWFLVGDFGDKRRGEVPFCQPRAAKFNDDMNACGFAGSWL